MNSKIFSLFIFSIFLLSSVSAMTVYGDFTGGGQSATITQGSGFSFNVDFFSMSPPISSMKVQVFQGNNLIRTFLDSSTSSRAYSNTYSYTPTAAGTYTIKIIGTDDLNTDSEFLTLIVNSQNPIDTTNPVITLLGPNPQTIIRGNSYHEYGATATDNIDGDLTNEIIIDSGDVNTNLVGTYAVTYNVQDSSGNPAITRTRTVNVVSSNNGDATPPEITIISPKENHEYDTCDISIKVSTDENADVTFRLDQGVVRDMNSHSDNTFTYTLNDLSDGRHYLTFYAEDDSGNQARESISFDINCDENHNQGESTGFIGNDFYSNNKYYDQFAGNTFNSGTVSSGTGGVIYDTNKNTQSQNSDNTLLIIFLVTLITAFSALLIGLAIFIARKPINRIQGQRPVSQGPNPESYY